MTPLFRVLVYLIKNPLESLNIIFNPIHFPFGREVAEISIDKDEKLITKKYRKNKISFLNHTVKICQQFQDKMDFIPKMIKTIDRSLVQEYVGELVDVRYNLPVDWKIQLKNMQNKLNKEKILCSDVEIWDLNPYIVNNLCIKNGKLYIVDFGTWKLNSKKTSFKKLISDIEYTIKTPMPIVLFLHVIKIIYKIGTNLLGKLIPDEVIFVILLVTFFLSLMTSSLIAYSNNLRNTISRFCFNFLFLGSYYLLKNNIYVSGNLETFSNQEINILNANHTYQFDNFIFFYLFHYFKILGSKTTSISTINGIGYIDKQILRLADSYYIQKNTFPNWNSKKYVINFFEGIASCNTNHKPNKPQSLLLKKMLEIYPEKMKYLTHIDIKYHYKGTHTPIKESNNKIWKLVLLRKVNIRVNIKHYKMPSVNNCDQWLDKLYNS